MVTLLEEVTFDAIAVYGGLHGGKAGGSTATVVQHEVLKQVKTSHILAFTTK